MLSATDSLSAAGMCASQRPSCSASQSSPTLLPPGRKEAGWMEALRGSATLPCSQGAVAEHGLGATSVWGMPRLAQCVLGSPNAASRIFRSKVASSRRPAGSQQTGWARRGPPLQPWCSVLLLHRKRPPRGTGTRPAPRSQESCRAEASCVFASTLSRVQCAPLRPRSTAEGSAMMAGYAVRWLPGSTTVVLARELSLPHT
mmetsp:Transcript_55454/g.148523  ORF Transcript_55454/g.148523 Transcript_55454/m.148523 type:complete len:201 (-) Transcript_55454:722-1324(-)